MKKLHIIMGPYWEDTEQHISGCISIENWSKMELDELVKLLLMLLFCSS